MQFSSKWALDESLTGQKKSEWNFVPDLRKNTKNVHFTIFGTFFKIYVFGHNSRRRICPEMRVHQNEPIKSLLLDTKKKQNNSTTQTGEIFERLSRNVNLVPFGTGFSASIFGVMRVNRFEIWERAFRKYCLSCIWNSNQISVCSFRSRDLCFWKVVPKGPRPTPPLIRALISQKRDFFQTCSFHHELEKG